MTKRAISKTGTAQFVAIILFAFIGASVVGRTTALADSSDIKLQYAEGAYLWTQLVTQRFMLSVNASLGRDLTACVCAVYPELAGEPQCQSRSAKFATHTKMNVDGNVWQTTEMCKGFVGRVLGVATTPKKYAPEPEVTTCPAEPIRAIAPLAVAHPHKSEPSAIDGSNAHGESCVDTPELKPALELYTPELRRALRWRSAAIHTEVTSRDANAWPEYSLYVPKTIAFKNKDLNPDAASLDPLTSGERCEMLQKYHKFKNETCAAYFNSPCSGGFYQAKQNEASAAGRSLTVGQFCKSYIYSSHPPVTSLAEATQLRRVREIFVGYLRQRFDEHYITASDLAYDSVLNLFPTLVYFSNAHPSPNEILAVALKLEKSSTSRASEFEANYRKKYAGLTPAKLMDRFAIDEDHGLVKIAAKFVNAEAVYNTGAAAGAIANRIAGLKSVEYKAADINRGADRTMARLSLYTSLYNDVRDVGFGTAYAEALFKKSFPELAPSVSSIRGRVLRNLNWKQTFNGAGELVAFMASTAALTGACEVATLGAATWACAPAGLYIVSYFAMIEKAKNEMRARQEEFFGAVEQIYQISDLSQMEKAESEYLGQIAFFAFMATGQRMIEDVFKHFIVPKVASYLNKNAKSQELLRSIRDGALRAAAPAVAASVVMVRTGDAENDEIQVKPKWLKEHPEFSVAIARQFKFRDVKLNPLSAAEVNWILAGHEIAAVDYPVNALGTGGACVLSRLECALLETARRRMVKPIRPLTQEEQEKIELEKRQRTEQIARLERERKTNPRQYACDTFVDDNSMAAFQYKLDEMRDQIRQQAEVEGAPVVQSEVDREAKAMSLPGKPSKMSIVKTKKYE